MNSTMIWTYDGAIQNKMSVRDLIAIWKSWKKELELMPRPSTTRKTFIQSYERDIDFLEQYRVK